MNGETVHPIGGRALEVLSATPRLTDWLFSKVRAGVSGDVLEIGSGIGNVSKLIRAQADRLVVSDEDPGYLDRLRDMFKGDTAVEVVRYDLERPPSTELASRRFDSIVGINVVEHISDDVGLLRNLAGLLKPGGRLLVYVPACPFAFGAIDVALGHRRRYTPALLAERLRAAGLQVSTPRYCNLLGLLGWFVNGRLFRRDTLSRRQMALFERLMPLVRLEDRVRLPIGLGVYAVGVRPVVEQEGAAAVQAAV